MSTSRPVGQGRTWQHIERRIANIQKMAQILFRAGANLEAETRNVRRLNNALKKKVVALQNHVTALEEQMTNISEEKEHFAAHLGATLASNWGLQKEVEELQVLIQSQTMTPETETQ